MKITVVVPYQITKEPKSGGVLRIYHLFKDTGATLVGYGEERGTELFSNSLIQETYPKTLLRLFTEKILERYIDERASNLISSYWFCKKNVLYKTKINTLAKKSDVLITELPYHFSLIKNYKNKLLIYNAHNVEYLLQKEVLPNNLLGKILANQIKKAEEEACVKSHIVFACSEEDKKKLCSLYNILPKKIFVVPNGTTIENTSSFSTEEKLKERENWGLGKKDIILFVGSRYKPNLDAVNFIHRELAPPIPEKNFLVAGEIVELFLDKYPEIQEMQKSFFSISQKPSAYGLHKTEFWPNNLCVRWTRKTCVLKIPGEITSFSINIKCPRRIKGYMSINGKKVLSFQSNRKWEKIGTSFEKTKNPLIEIHLDKTWKPLQDSRRLGIAISKLMYTSENKEKEIPLSNLRTLGFKSNNVFFLSHFTEKEKVSIFAMSDVAINPMSIGSGTNLKMFEYMNYQLPIITTKKGARGIEQNNNNKAFVVCKKNEFKQTIKNVSGDKKLQEKLKNNATFLVENKYNWNCISKDMIQIIKQHTSANNKSL